jgi:hypothetical protein
MLLCLLFNLGLVFGICGKLYILRGQINTFCLPIREITALNEPVKPQSQTSTHKTIGRCALRSNKISWCKKLNKSCAGPNDYNSCSNYKPKPAKTQHNQYQTECNTFADEEEIHTSHALLIGVKMGKCDICKKTKKILLLRYGFCLCDDCLNFCATILERLAFDDRGQPKKTDASYGESPLSSKTKTEKRHHYENTF